MRLSDGGTVRAVLDWCEALAARGHEVTLLTADAKDVPPSWSAPGAGSPRCVILDIEDALGKWLGKRPAPGAPDKPTQVLTRGSMEIASRVLRGADCLHLHGVWATSNAQLASRARRLGTPYVVSPHGMLDHWSLAQGAAKKRLHLAMVSGRVLRGAKHVLCTAEGELDQAAAHFDRSRGRVVPLLFDTAAFRELPGPEAARRRFGLGDAPVILFLSRLHAKKGADRLLRAAGLLKDRPWKLVLAGPADPPEYGETLVALARELGIADRVLFPGMVTGSDKVSLFCAAAVFALPTSQENFGFVLLEALSAGVPVVTTKGVDIWPELEASGGAVICEPDAQSLAGCVARLLEDLGARERMGKAGREWAMARLDAGVVIRRYEEVYAGGAQGGTP
ncbi:MAG: glycosyltransferase [Phycisphaerales bacterium]